MAYWLATGRGHVWSSDHDAYGDIVREELADFSIIDGAKIVLSVPVDSISAPKFVYRRRTRMTTGGPKQIMHVVGFLDGPVWIYDENSKAVFVDRFHDEGHAVVDFSWPEVHEAEGESFCRVDQTCYHLGRTSKRLERML